MSLLDKIINFIFGNDAIVSNESINNVNEEEKTDGPTYEDDLLKQYGNINEPNKKLNIRIMFIADTHDCLYYKKDLQEYIKNEPNIDVYLLLGDLSGYDCDLLKEIIPNDKMFGIVGNHDSWNRLKDAGINDINGQLIDVNGIKIAAIAGSTKYKEGDYGMYTQEEAMEIAEKLPSADILISHDKPFLKDEGDYVHDGLKAITYYLYKNKTPYHFHGHLHYEFNTDLKNGTKSQCIYRVKVVEL